VKRKALNEKVKSVAIEVSLGENPLQSGENLEKGKIVIQKMRRQMRVLGMLRR
jgi:hypothetical protein